MSEQCTVRVPHPVDELRSIEVPSPGAIVDVVKRVMPGVRADVALDRFGGGYQLRLEFARAGVNGLIGLHMLRNGGARHAVEGAVSALQRKLIDDLGIDSFAARRVIELEGQVDEERAYRKRVQKDLDDLREARATDLAYLEAKVTSVIGQARREHAKVDSIRNALGIRPGRS